MFMILHAVGAVLTICSKQTYSNIDNVKDKDLLNKLNFHNTTDLVKYSEQLWIKEQDNNSTFLDDMKTTQAFNP